MRFGEKLFPESLNATLIAPCGMNCGLCSGYLREKREKNRCAGCNGDDAGKPHSCVACPIKRCDELKAGAQEFCFACVGFPCARLRRLDARYRTRYGMSMIENLKKIRDLGPERFAAAERERWRCPACGGIVCVHHPSCVYCGHPRG